MAMTPYPGGNNDFENPSILVSDDAETWIEPTGIANPIVAFPGGGAFNADVDIVVAQDGKMYCYYMSSDGATYNKCMVVSSTNGIIWGNTAELFSSAAVGIASPAVIWDGGKYVMWYVDASESPYKLYRRTSTSPNADWSEPVAAGFNSVPSRDIWHLDVIYDGTKYYSFMVFCDATKTGDNSILYFGRSDDGITWTIDDGQLLDGAGSGAWDETRIHRSSGLRTANGFDLWYSARSYSPTVWHIGKTEVLLP